jgi:hypothetical protein
MRLRPLLPLLLVLLAAGLASGSVVTTTPNILSGNNRNVVFQATINSTENVLVLNVTEGRARTVQLFSQDTAWYLRTTTGDTTTQIKVAQDQVVTLEIASNTTLYFLRQSADGTLTILPVK